MKTLILGIGNALRGDDGLGAAAAEAIAASSWARGLTVLTVTQLLPELTETFSQFDRVIILDARAQGLPGRVTVEAISPAPQSGLAFSHFASASGLLAATQAIYGRHPEASLVSVDGESFGYRQSLSASVAAALPDVLQRVRALAEPPEKATLGRPCDA